MYVCGQNKFLQNMQRLISDNNFPRFSILCGAVGSGKHLLADAISRMIPAKYIICESNVDGVRQAINVANTQTNDAKLFVFPDIESMSISASNSLLKFAEEPPNNTYIIITVHNLESVLGTLISRAHIFYVDRYAKDDLLDYIEHNKYEFTNNDIVLSLCETPGDINIAHETDIDSLYGLAEKFVDFIGTANIGNELKIPTLISVKENDGKLNYVLFMRGIIQVAIDRMKQSNNDSSAYYAIVSETSKYLSAMMQTGRSKQMLLDNWIISLHMRLVGAVE